MKSFANNPSVKIPNPWRVGAFIALAVCLAAPLRSAEPEYRLAAWWKPELLSIDQRLAAIGDEIEKLPQMPDMDARGTHGFHSDFTLESESNWFRIDWPEPREIDAAALIPTRLTTQSGEMSNYGLPHRLRIEAGLPGRDQPVILSEIADTRLDTRRGEPLFFKFPAVRVLWLRFVPVDLPTLPGKSVRFFSAAEALAFEGGKNIAPHGKLSARFSIDAETGWNLRYLTDGKSPLGPPELPGAPDSLGWHTDISHSRDTITWAEIDLQRPRRIDAVRLIAAKGDSPVKGPGFGFPVRFEIQTSSSEGGDDAWRTVWESGARPFQNPGYNAVTLAFAETEARRVRLLIREQHQPDSLTIPRVLLSEFEALEGTANHALGMPVRTSDTVASRPHDGRRVWSAAGLTDGHSSTGRIMPLRPWAEQLAKRFDLETERRALLVRRTLILGHTRATVLTGAFAALATAIIGLILWQIRIRLAARRHIQSLRRRIAGDLHDEVGSNLATISLLAEIGSSHPDTGSAADISRLARESSLSLREIIDFTLVPKRVRKPLPERLREIADVMLRGITWNFTESGPLELDLEKRRSLVFFFKEALHNIIRHSGASHVELRLETGGRSAILRVSDNGAGLPQRADSSDCLRTLKQRAEALGGRLDVRSSPGSGTHLELTFPTRTP